MKSFFYVGATLFHGLQNRITFFSQIRNLTLYLCHFPPLSGHTLIISSFYSPLTCQRRSWSCNSLFVGRAAHCLMFFLQQVLLVCLFSSHVFELCSYSEFLCASISGLYGLLVQKILLGSLSDCILCESPALGFRNSRTYPRITFFIPKACV